jgi:hypothetical protein
MMAMRTSHKRAARDAFDREDDIYAFSDDISEDESYGSYQADRMSSPKSALEMPTVLTAKTKTQPVIVEDDEDAEKRVTIWNWREQRKLSGNSAPFKKNLQEYLRKHPDWEEYVGQDKDENGKKNFAPKKRRKEITNKTGVMHSPILDGNRKPVAALRIHGDAEVALVATDSMARRRVTEASTRQRIQAEAEAAWRHAKEEAAKQKEQEEKEACRWREFSAIQHIIDHYNQGPAKSPFCGDNAMMNA